MKVLLVFPRVPFPEKDGGAVAMASLIRSVNAIGIQADLYFFNTSKHFVDRERIKELYEPLCNELHVYELNNYVSFKGALMNLCSKSAYHISRFNKKVIGEELKTLVSQNAYDIVHFDGLQSSAYLPQLKSMFSGVKFVLRQHNVEHQIWDKLREEVSFLKSMYLGLQVKRLKKFEEEMIQRADLVLAISKTDAAIFNSKGATSKVLGIGLEVVNEVEELHSLDFFHIGSMDWAPNQEGVNWLVHDVWPAVLKSYPEAALHLAGRHFPTNRDWNQVTGVTCHGEVEDAAGFMQSHSVMLVPIRSGSGIRIKILEAMALGKIVISTSQGVEGLDVQNGEHLFIANTEAEFLDVINLIHNETDLHEIQEKAVNFVRENYSESAFGNELNSYYQGILA